MEAGVEHIQAPLRSTIIRKWSDFEHLEIEWNRLLSESEASSIFLTWEWINAWRRAAKLEIDPYIIVVRDALGALVGLAPMYVSRLSLFGFVHYKTLRYIADIATGSEYPDWIIKKQIEADVVAEIACALASDTKSWDLLWLRRVAGWTGARNRLISAGFCCKFWINQREQQFSAIELRGSLDEYEARLSTNRRQQIRRNSRKISALDDVHFELCGERDQVGQYMEALFALHQKHWTRMGQDGNFQRKPAEERFYREFVPMAFEKKWLSVFGLKSGGEIKAVQFGYMFNGVYCQLQEGYDPDFESGAGNALRHYAISECIKSGIKTYDFLGGWSEHKRRWGAEIRSGYEFLISAKKVRNVLVFFAKVWPSGRYMKIDDRLSK